MKRDSLDALFSDYIRTRAEWRCLRCFKQYPVKSKGLHAAHIYSRGRKSLRHDPDNAISLCYGCHRFADQHKDTVLYPLYVSIYGQEKFDELTLKANTPRKVDLIEARTKLINLMEGLCQPT